MPEVVALPWGTASTAIPMISARDVACVAVGVLTGKQLGGAPPLSSRELLAEHRQTFIELVGQAA